MCRVTPEKPITTNRLPAQSQGSALLPVPLKDINHTEEEQILRPLPRDVENLADDPQLHNPLQRSERLSTGWFGVSSRLTAPLADQQSHLCKHTTVLTGGGQGAVYVQHASLTVPPRRCGAVSFCLLPTAGCDGV